MNPRSAARAVIAIRDARKGVNRAWAWVLAGVLLCELAGTAAQAGVVVSPNDALQGLLGDPGVTATDRAIREIALTAIQDRRHDEAIARLRSLEIKAPNDERISFLLTLAYLGKGELSQALETSRRCVQVRPAWQVGYWLMGAVLAVQGQISQAEAAFDQAIRIAPREPGGYFQRGSFLVGYRSESPTRLRAALVDLNKALELGAPAGLIHGFVGKIHRKLNDLPSAEKYLLLATQDPTNLEALADLVGLYDATARPERAERVLAEAEYRLPATKPPAQARSELFLIRARHAQATSAPFEDVLRYFRQAIDARPSHASLRLECARWLDQVGRNVDAIPLLREGLQSPPFDMDLAAQLAWALAETGRDLDEARQWLQRARERSPRSPYLADTAAWIEYQGDQSARAWTEIQTALPLVDSIPEVAYHAGAIQARLGHPEEAVRYLQKALKIGRSFPGDAAAKGLLRSLQTGQAQPPKAPGSRVLP